MGQHEVADRMEPVRDPVRDVPGRPARALHARPCIRLLGRPRLLDADGRASGLQYRKGWALLAWLSLESRGACRRTRLAALLWPRLPESAALTNLRQVLADLNRSLLHALGTEVLHCDRTQVHWRLPAAVALDVAQLHRSIDPALPRDCGSTLCMLDAGALEGELLEGIELDECEEFGQWLAVVRESLARNRVRAIEAVRDCLVREGRMAEAIGWARSLVAMDGWDESRCRGLMRVLALAGEHGQALDAYHRLERALRHELGVEPEPESRAMYMGILASRRACELALADQMLAGQDRRDSGDLPSRRGRFRA